MKNLLCVLLVVLSVSLPAAKTIEIDAYKNYGTNTLVLENSVDTFMENSALRHLCKSE